MNAVIRGIAAVAVFLYQFIVGDDIVVAGVMLLALVATGLLAANGVQAWWLVPILAVVMTGVNLWRTRAAARSMP